MGEESDSSTEGSVLVQGQGQRWWVEGHEPPPPPVEDTVDIVDVKVTEYIIIQILCLFHSPKTANEIFSNAGSK